MYFGKCIMHMSHDIKDTGQRFIRLSLQGQGQKSNNVFYCKFIICKRKSG